MPEIHDSRPESEQLREELRKAKKEILDLQGNQIQFVQIVNHMLSGTQFTREYFGALKDVLAVAKGCGIE